MSERKIYLKNTSPRVITNWFEKYPPVSGTGKLKYAEALIQLKNNEESELIKEGWIDADLNRSELRFYRKNLRKF